jgi:hypothetical protein
VAALPWHANCRSDLSQPYAGTDGALATLERAHASLPVTSLSDSATGFTCPRCGGSVWEDAPSESLAFHCRIGHQFSLAAMLAEHGSRRGEALSSAWRYIAEAAALNRRIADWARTHEHVVAAIRLDREAEVLERTAEALQRLAASSLVPPFTGEDP